MPYITEEGMIDRFGEDEITQLTDKEGQGALNGDVLSLAMSDADQEIDAYLSFTYRTPLENPVPSVISRFAADIARYNLFENGATQEAEKRYERAIKFLKAVALGQAAIPGVKPMTDDEKMQARSGDSKGSFAANKSSFDRVFTMDSLTGL